MSDHPFLFSMRLPGTRGFDAIVADVASNVLTHFGFEAAAIDELSGALRTGLTSGRAGGADLHVQFQVHAGELEILVSQHERRVCRVASPLPGVGAP